RAWRESDADSLGEHANNFNVSRWMVDNFPHPYTQADAEFWVREGHAALGTNWAIAFEDQAVGGCGMVPEEGMRRCNCQVGWWLGQGHWGKGVVTSVARALVARAFENPQTTRVYAPIYAGNLRSMRVAEKAGMVLEGIQRKGIVKSGR